MPENADGEQKLIDAIYRGACDPAELKRAIELIAQHFDSSGVVLAELDQGAPNAPLTIGARSMDQAFFANYAPFASLDPAPRAFAALKVGTVSTTDRMFSEDFLRTSIFLNEFLRPHGVDATLGGPLLSTGGRFALVGVHQATSRQRFGDEDVARLERLTPHLTRALQITRLFLQNELRSQTLEAIINHSRTAMIGLPGDGPALFVNDAASAIATACDGIGLDRQGRLLVADRAAAQRLAALEADVARGGAGGLVRIQRPSGRTPYQVLVSPLPTRDGVLPQVQRGVLIAIHDPSNRVATTVETIEQVLHMPKGPAKVVKAILDGAELKDYAEESGISIHTVRFHLKTAFARTGTRSQAALVRRALLALADLGPIFPNG